MIYIFVGNDNKKKSTQIKKIVSGVEPIKLFWQDVSNEILKEYVDSQSLFGDLQAIVIDGYLSKKDTSFSKEELLKLESSKNMFIFLEDKLLASLEKKYDKHAKIEHFEESIIKQTQKVNVFAIADSFAKRDKIGTWIQYIEAVESGVEPEAISGMLFWKIKTMILNKTKTFSEKELKNQSSQIVSIYHLAHRGSLDFKIGLEQFILTSLSI